VVGGVSTHAIHRGDAVKISIITAVYNREKTIAQAMDSVLSQDYPDIEYIVVDGMSNDGTDDVVRRYDDRLAVSIREKDAGIYDALNKGVRAATGDVIGFLHADDFLASSQSVSRIATVFRDPNVDGTYGDLQYVDASDPTRIKRFWVAGDYRASRFRWGWMPPHPTVYLRRDLYSRYGGFRQDFQIAADYELLVRMMVKHQIRMRYLQEIVVKMRVGGKSNASLRNRLTANREDRLAWKVNDLSPPPGLRWMKPMRKVTQFAKSALGWNS